MEIKTFFILLIWMNYAIVHIEGGCNWPEVFQSSTWRDNTRGDLTFATSTMSGWSFTSYSSTVSNWECLDASDFSTDGTLLLKATDTISLAGSTWVSYLCLKMTKVTQNSYYYYQQHAQQPNAAQERVKIDELDTLTTRSEICGSTTIPTSEFHFLVKSGSEESAKQYCPPSLLKKMDYVYTGSDSSVACNTSADNWDVCTDRKIMSFNYTSCAQKMAYSASGEVWCMVNITSTHEYVVVYNTDTSLTTDVTYRFSCFVVSSDGTKASMIYNNCTSVQTPTSFAKTHDGSDIGALLTMRATETCPFLGPDSGDEPPNLIPIIVGVVVGVVVIAIIIAVIVYCLKRKKSNVAPIDKRAQEAKGSPTSNGSAKSETVMGLEKSPLSENPALIADPEKRTLDPLPTKTILAESSELSPRNIEKLPPIKNGKSG